MGHAGKCSPAGEGGGMREYKEVGDAANIATWRRGHLAFLTSGL